MMQPRRGAHLGNGIRVGNSFPLGSEWTGDGVNFCIFANGAAQLELLLFDDIDAAPARVIPLSAKLHRTGHYWHVHVGGVGPGQLYGWRAHGPRARRFDGQKLLLDPYARAVAVPRTYDREAGARPGDNAQVAMKSVVTWFGDYDWQGDHPLHRPFAETVIYELHVGGFTKHESSGVPSQRRGTYAGLIDKIPYLQDLGITAVELLPVFQFDEQHGMKGLTNYWGYSPVSFFAPHVGFAQGGSAQSAMTEFRDMVKALHRAGIEVILDVVYNHTAEGEADLGPIQSLRGLADAVYYAQDAQGQYLDYTGTGNTINANHAVVRRLILDSLTYWVREMHVDGFRFDLASILSRGSEGRPMRNPPILWAIDSEPALAGAKLVAEAWDAGGLYQVGSFIGDRFTEWNGKFRDDVRAFLRGDDGFAKRFASRLIGSPDIYAHKGREATHSINFVTCHDGFTLNDLVSYNKKYNEENREESRDGTDMNLSWNCGVEGPADDLEVERLRERQIRNFLSILLLSLGTPMLLAGDEFRRTQRGNNNPWCQDNEVSWVDWRLLDAHSDLHRFVKGLLQLRRLRDISRLDHDEPLPELLRRAQITWHGVHLHRPDFGHHSHSIAVSVESLSNTYVLHAMVNAWSKPLQFEVPPAPAAPHLPWRKILDTSAPPPCDLLSLDQAPETPGPRIHVDAHSVVVLISPTEELLVQIA